MRSNIYLFTDKILVFAFSELLVPVLKWKYLRTIMHRIQGDALLQAVLSNGKVEFFTYIHLVAISATLPNYIHIFWIRSVGWELVITRLLTYIRLHIYQRSFVRFVYPPPLKWAPDYDLFVCFMNFSFYHRMKHSLLTVSVYIVILCADFKIQKRTRSEAFGIETR